MLQMCFLDVAFCNEGFECSHQHETDVAVGFIHFSTDELSSLCSKKMIFDVAHVNF
jgi:hypothetical protein